MGWLQDNYGMVTGKFLDDYRVISGKFQEIFWYPPNMILYIYQHFTVGTRGMYWYSKVTYCFGYHNYL